MCNIIIHALHLYAPRRVPNDSAIPSARAPGVSSRRVFGPPSLPRTQPAARRRTYEVFPGPEVSRRYGLFCFLPDEKRNALFRAFRRRPIFASYGSPVWIFSLVRHTCASAFCICIFPPLSSRRPRSRARLLRLHAPYAPPTRRRSAPDECLRLRRMCARRTTTRARRGRRLRRHRRPEKTRQSLRPTCGLGASRSPPVSGRRRAVRYPGKSALCDVRGGGPEVTGDSQTVFRTTFSNGKPVYAV